MLVRCDFSKANNYNAELNKVTTPVRAATGAILGIMYNLKGGTWSTRMKLYDRMIKPVLFYLFFFSPQVWAINCFDEIEKLQSSFLKNTLKAPFITPDQAVRLETGSPSLFIFILHIKLCTLRMYFMVLILCLVIYLVFVFYLYFLYLTVTRL